MDFAAARRNMVENQIRTNRVDDSGVTSALSLVPREVFLPKAMRGFAYVDEAIEAAPGRWMMAPLVLARLLQAAELKPSDVAMTIGDATGYITAEVARMASAVVSLEADPDLAPRAGAALVELGVDNAAVVQGPLAKGFPAQGPYDVILFAGAVDDVPVAICRQLADGGRLLAVVRDGRGLGKAMLMVRVGDSFGRRVLFEATAPMLPGFTPKEHFAF